MAKRLLLLLSVLAVLSGVWGCARTASAVPDLVIASGSENESLAPMVERFARQKGYHIQLKYMGSVDMMLALESPDLAYDAVWPAHNVWIALGDEKLKRVKNVESILRSPVVFGIRSKLAQELGFVGREVSMADLLAATEKGRLRFMMTNATQSNSGAIAYLAFIYSFLGQPDVIRAEDLDRPDLAIKLRSLLSAVNRSSGSSGWLKDLYLSADASYDGMVNYEAMIIEVNQELTKRGKEPLYVIYPSDGQAIADSPLGYVEHGNARAKKVFSELQAYLLSESVQKELLKLGRRTGLVGLGGAQADPQVFNPAWGIDVQRVINQIPLPQPAVVRKALQLYQTVFRKPSLTVYALDYSGSMAGQGVESLREAMGLLLNQEQAARWMLQTGPNDVTIVIPFSGAPLATWVVEGNKSADLDKLLRSIQGQRPEGGTDIYLPAQEGIKLLRQRLATLDRYQPAIILMTDGKSNSERNWPALQREWQSLGRDVPIHGILFGSADPKQVQAIATLTRGRVFDGTKDLVSAFRSVKGYN